MTAHWLRRYSLIMKHDSISTVNLEDRPASGLRRKLYIIIFEADTRYGRLFDIFLLWAILISIIAVVFESEKNIKANFEDLFVWIEWSITLFFTAEYLLRIYCTRRPLKYIFSFFGTIDLLAVLPAYLTFIFPSSQYLIVVRVLRLMRVFRILKLARFVKAAKVLGDALHSSRHKIAIFLGALMSLVLIMGTCMYIVEGDQEGFSSIPRSMYWTIVTMTTVGYGDVVPTTTLGKIVASLMMLIGYAIIAVPTGIVTSEIAEAQKKQKACPKCGASLHENR